jgi:hypothetical protein
VAAAPVLLAAALMSQPAAAGVFSATAGATLGYSLQAGAMPDISFQHTPTVNLFDAAVGDASLTPGVDSFVLASNVAGNGEVADSNTESDLVITIENLTRDTVELAWALDFDLGVSAAYALPGESAYAEAFISLFSDGFVLDGDADLDELLEVDADSLDTPPDALAGNRAFTLELLDGETAEVMLTIGTYGYATGTEVTVPAPPAFALFGLGLGLLGLRRATARRSV